MPSFSSGTPVFFGFEEWFPHWRQFFPLLVGKFYEVPPETLSRRNALMSDMMSSLELPRRRRDGQRRALGADHADCAETTISSELCVYQPATSTPLHIWQIMNHSLWKVSS